MMYRLSEKVSNVNVYEKLGSQLTYNDLLLQIEQCRLKCKEGKERINVKAVTVGQVAEICKIREIKAGETKIQWRYSTLKWLRDGKKKNIISKKGGKVLEGRTEFTFSRQFQYIPTEQLPKREHVCKIKQKNPHFSVFHFIQ